MNPWNLDSQILHDAEQRHNNQAPLQASNISGRAAELRLIRPRMQPALELDDSLNSVTRLNATVRCKLLSIVMIDLTCNIINFLLSSQAVIHSYWWYYSLLFYMCATVYTLVLSILICSSSKFNSTLLNMIKSYKQFRQLLVVIYFVAFDVALMMYLTVLYGNKSSFEYHPSASTTRLGSMRVVYTYGKDILLVGIYIFFQLIFAGCTHGKMQTYIEYFNSMRNPLL